MLQGHGRCQSTTIKWASKEGITFRVPRRFIKRWVARVKNKLVEAHSRRPLMLLKGLEYYCEYAHRHIFGLERLYFAHEDALTTLTRQCAED